MASVELIGGRLDGTVATFAMDVGDSNMRFYAVVEPFGDYQAWAVKRGGTVATGKACVYRPLSGEGDPVLFLAEEVCTYR